MYLFCEQMHLSLCLCCILLTCWRYSTLLDTVVYQLSEGVENFGDEHELGRVEFHHTNIIKKLGTLDGQFESLNSFFGFPGSNQFVVQVFDVGNVIFLSNLFQDKLTKSRKMLILLFTCNVCFVSSSD